MTATSPFDFSTIQQVHYSYWTGEFYLMGQSFQGREWVTDNDNELWQALHVLVEDWLIEAHDDESYCVYSRPQANT